MRTQVNTSFGIFLRGLAAMFWIAFSCATGAQLASTTYYTTPGATVEESGTYVTNGSRTVPLTATLTFDLTATTPSLTAVIHDAVLEGGHPFYTDGLLEGRQQPFELTVRSSSGMQLGDGSYRFTGDYLQDIYPSGTQYGFDWHFSTDGMGSVFWNGFTGWVGGHLWLVTITDVALVPEPSSVALLGFGGLLFAANCIRKRRSKW